MESGDNKRKYDDTGTNEVEVDNKRSRTGTQRLLLTEVAVDGLEIKSFDRTQHTKSQKRFKYKLSLAESLRSGLEPASQASLLYLDVWVMDNNLSILMLPFAVSNVVHIETKLDLFKFKPDIAKGKSKKQKMKKGVRLADAREVLAEVSCFNAENGASQVYHLVSPVQGRLLEFNHQILNDNSLLSSRPFSDGFIAVLLSVVPDIIGRCGPSILSLESDVSISQLCFQWIRGNCAKGESCKYFHPISNVPERQLCANADDC
jgi:hypothetical protein